MVNNDRDKANYNFFKSLLSTRFVARLSGFNRPIHHRINLLLYRSLLSNFRIFLSLSFFENPSREEEEDRSRFLLLEKQISGVPPGFPPLAAQLRVEGVILVRGIVQEILGPVRVNFHSRRDLVHQTFRARVEVHT